MRAPSHLSKEAKVFWKKLAPLVAESPRNEELLGILCNAMAEQRAATELIEKYGLVVNGAHGGYRPNPAIAIRDRAVSIIQRLSKELLGTAAKEPQDELDELLGDK